MPVSLDIYKSVVRVINTSDREGHDSVGSGVVFTPSGLILTNNHVVEDPDFGTAFGKISVEWLNRVHRPASESARAEIVIRNEVYDLAVLQIVGMPPSRYMDVIGTESVDESFIERSVRVLGYPPLGGNTITVTRGIVSGFDEAGNLKTDAEINRGNSGGAALDDFDNFLGIPTFIVVDAPGKIGYIISRDRISEWFRTVLPSGVPTSTRELAALFDKGNLQFRDGNLDQSTRYPRILGKFAAVESLLANKEFDKVMRHADFIVERRPRSALAYHYRGNALLGLGNYVEAATQFCLAIQYDPDFVPALGNYGVTLTQLARHSEALNFFEQIIDKADNPADLWTAYSNIAQIYRSWNKPDVAALYSLRADELSAAASECLSRYRHTHDPNDKITAITNAFVQAELQEDE